MAITDACGRKAPDPVPCACGGQPRYRDYDGSHDEGARVECWTCGVATAAGSDRDLTQPS